VDSKRDARSASGGNGDRSGQDEEALEAPWRLDPRCRLESEITVGGVEIVASCAPSGDRDVAPRLQVHRFLKMFDRLFRMTGTQIERAELVMRERLPCNVLGRIG